MSDNFFFKNKGPFSIKKIIAISDSKNSLEFDRKIKIHDITDLLALSYCKRFVASNSMWSEFCSIYRKVPTIYPPNCFKVAPREGLFYTK